MKDRIEKLLAAVGFGALGGLNLACAAKCVSIVADILFGEPKYTLSVKLKDDQGDKTDGAPDGKEDPAGV